MISSFHFSGIGLCTGSSAGTKEKRRIRISECAWKISFGKADYLS